MFNLVQMDENKLIWIMGQSVPSEKFSDDTKLGEVVDMPKGHAH